jgi:hypothetical protein
MRLHQFSPSATDLSPTKTPDISNSDDEGAQLLSDIKDMAAHLSRFLDDAAGGSSMPQCSRPKRPAKADGR